MRAAFWRKREAENGPVFAGKVGTEADALLRIQADVWEARQRRREKVRQMGRGATSTDPR